MSTPHSANLAARAETFDDATLRRVFPDAPDDLAVPRDVRAIFRQRMRDIGGHRRIAGLILLTALTAMGVILIAAQFVVAGIVALAAVVVLLIGIPTWQYSKASNDFFGLYAAARGLNYEEDGRMAGQVPLFRKGDERTWPRVMDGQICGTDASLGLYTYTEVSTDSEGRRTSTDYDYTVFRVTLPEAVAARFAGVYLAPKGWSLGGLQDKFAHDRGVQLESAEFHKRYSLRVVDEQDDIALYELFSPPFIHWLATDMTIYWQQRGGDLVFWRKGHEHEAADLDRFCVDGERVVQRYLEEYR